MDKLWGNIKDSWAGSWFVLKRPAWLALALLIGFLVSTLIYFSVNIGFYGPLFMSLPFLDIPFAKVVMITSMVKSYFADANGLLLLVVSILQGVAITIFIFTAKKNKKMDSQIVGRGGVAMVLAVFGLGCVPCGTSLLIPVMTLVFSSSAPALLGTANALILLAALVLTVYSLYKIGLVAYKYKISEV